MDNHDNQNPDGWSEYQQVRFLLARAQFGDDWEKIAEYVGTRTVYQVQLYARSIRPKDSRGEEQKQNGCNKHLSKNFTIPNFTRQINVQADYPILKHNCVETNQTAVQPLVRSRNSAFRPYDVYEQELEQAQNLLMQEFLQDNESSRLQDQESQSNQLQEYEWRFVNVQDSENSDDSSQRQSQLPSDQDQLTQTLSYETSQPGFSQLLSYSDEPEQQ